MTTLSPGVLLHFGRIDDALTARQQELKRTRDGLATDMRMAVHMSPPPPVLAACDKIDEAIAAIGTLRDVFRALAPAGAKPRGSWPA